MKSEESIDATSRLCESRKVLEKAQRVQYPQVEVEEHYLYDSEQGRNRGNFQDIRRQNVAGGRLWQERGFSSVGCQALGASQKCYQKIA